MLSGNCKTGHVHCILSTSNLLAPKPENTHSPMFEQTFKNIDDTIRFFKQAFLNRLLDFLAILAASLFFTFPFATVAQTVGHNNQLDISLLEDRHLQCDFSLNLLPLLHSHLAPKSHPEEFLHSFLKLSDAAMDKELDKLTRALSDQSFFTLPTGTKLRLKQWQLPSKQLIREVIKVNLLLMQMPPNAAAHIDPMLVQAKASSKVPVTRVQLQLHPALSPIFVVHKQDKFWLTPEIPSAIMDIN